MDDILKEAAFRGQKCDAAQNGFSGLQKYFSIYLGTYFYLPYLEHG